MTVSVSAGVACGSSQSCFDSVKYTLDLVPADVRNVVMTNGGK